jgi:hypothetical protein
VVNGLALTCKLLVWHSWEGPETLTGAYDNCCTPAHTVHIVNNFNFNLRRCAPVALFVEPARRLFERACRTGAGAITRSTQARQCSNSPLVVVGTFHFARKSIAWDFRIFVNKIDAWLHFLLANVRNLVRTFVEECIKVNGNKVLPQLPSGNNSAHQFIRIVRCVKRSILMHQCIRPALPVSTHP